MPSSGQRRKEPGPLTASASCADAAEVTGPGDLRVVVRQARREIATGSQFFQRLPCDSSASGVPLDGIPAYGIVFWHDSNS